MLPNMFILNTWRTGSLDATGLEKHVALFTQNMQIFSFKYYLIFLQFFQFTY